MLEIPGFKNLRKILWKDLDPGMIVIGGVKVNNGLPLELSSYPALTVSLIRDLTTKYHFLPNKEIIVAEAKRGESASRMSLGFRTIENRLRQFNHFRQVIQKEKSNQIQNKKLNLPPNASIITTSYLNQEHILKDVFNSFTVPKHSSNIPTMFSHLEEKITLADILTGKLKDKFILPDDSEIMLHLVVDYSYSMNTVDKLNPVISAVNLFYTHITECMLNVKIQLYVFSDQCIPVKFPLSGKEIERKGTVYANFMKKVLHLRNPDVTNKVILFTDGEPSDMTDAIMTGNKMKKLKMDYSQLIFELSEDRRIDYQGMMGKDKLLDGVLVGSNQGLTAVRLNDSEWKNRKEEVYEKFTEVAHACGGNQFILNVNELISLLAIEVYDRYLGLLTLSKLEHEKPKFPEFKIPTPKISPESFKEEIKQKTIKPFEFKKIERPK